MWGLFLAKPYDLNHTKVRTGGLVQACGDSIAKVLRTPFMVYLYAVRSHVIHVRRPQQPLCEVAPYQVCIECQGLIFAVTWH